MDTIPITDAGCLPSTALPNATDECLRVFSTCPSSQGEPDHYLRSVEQVSRWSENAGCAGILVYTDNSIADPWLVSQVILQSTQSLSPLVAVQPLYMHPFSVARMVSTLGFLHGRRVSLNLVAGGFKNDLAALHDATPHDARYQRLAEYAAIIRALLQNSGPVNFDGCFYKLTNATLRPKLAAELWPEMLVSGSSEAGLSAARQMGATAIQYPAPPGDDQQKAASDLRRGVRVGIVSRPREEDAWAVAYQRFPENRAGQLARQLAHKLSDSVWHHQLQQLGNEQDNARGPYWLHPFENYQTNCPYLVGSYHSVARELGRYLAQGYRTVILDIPPTEEELDHIGEVFKRVSPGRAQKTPWPQASFPDAGGPVATQSSRTEL